MDAMTWVDAAWFGIGILCGLGFRPLWDMLHPTKEDQDVHFTVPETPEADSWVADYSIEKHLELVNHMAKLLTEEQRGDSPDNSEDWPPRSIAGPNSDQYEPYGEKK